VQGFEADHKLPPILSRIDDSPNHRLILEISPELNWFQGHFPGNPVLPGVVQLHWAIMISISVFGFRDAPVEFKRLKFKRVVVPPGKLELTLCRSTENEVQFEYTSQGKQHSQGRLIFTPEAPC